MATLRSARGCPWDREQTHQTLRPYLIEEAYEAVGAIDRQDDGALPGELGDVLLQCVFHAQIGTEDGRFTITDVITAISDKLIRRHPHVFTEAGTPLSPATRRRSRVSTPRAVMDQWSALKAREQQATGAPARILSGLPAALPALLRASHIGARVAAVGFDWPDAKDAIAKVEEEVRELREAVSQSAERTLDEFGDLLFALTNVARHLQVDPEAALRHANDKFTRRFTALEADFEARGVPLRSATLSELDAVWTRIKLAESPTSSPAVALTRSSRGSRARPSRR
jgi:MazG family protein